MSRLDDLAAHCIRCGFCLESCPTFVLTGEEPNSPRGRIYLARSAEAGKIDWEATRGPIDECLGCRACETACPSGVEYGAILELARERLEASRPNRARRALLKGLTDPKRLRVQIQLGKLLPGSRIPGFVSKALSGQVPEVDKPTPQPLMALRELDESALPPIRGEVYLLEGCAMRTLFPNVHVATRRLLRRLGYAVRESSAGCCGSLYAHAGLIEEGTEKAQAVAAAMHGDLPVIVNSAGCGSHLKDLARHGETPSLNGRVFDVSEFLLENGLLEVIAKAPAAARSATYHDACHLAHGQKVVGPPRQLLEAIPGLKLAPLPEADMCCGSAGIYNVTQPKMARALLERKWKNVESTGAQWVVLGNPGCHAWIAQAAKEHGGAVRVLHLAEALELALSGLD